MSTTTKADIQAHKNSGTWRTLEKRALAMVADATRHAGVPFEPRLGGGTRLMLGLLHRISDDIDLFIRDPQWIGYLTPRLNDDIGQYVTGYSEAAVSLKLEYPEGEIDYVVGMSLLGLPDETSNDTQFVMEPIAEVLAKKLFYRGWALTPRDLFDWWAIETLAPETIPVEQMARLLKTKFDEIDRALQSITSSPAAATMWQGIKAPNKPELIATASWGRETLARYSDVGTEISRRVEALPSLANSAGAPYTFGQLATAEVQRVGSHDRVDWSLVEGATIRESIGKCRQSPESVAQALCDYSPGAVTAARQQLLRKEILEQGLRLQQDNQLSDAGPALGH